MRNLVVIMSDEHQARALGSAGHPFVQTPHLDALAARGTRFANAYTPSPICVPARASFATGLYPHQTRAWDNAMPYTGSPRGWGHALQDAGVRVESIGKLHYRDAGDDVGFDDIHIPMMVVDGVGMVWASERREDRRRPPGPNRMLGPKIGRGESSYTAYDRSVTDRAVAWLEDPPDTPWCLYVGLVAPHFPLIAPEEFYDLYAETPLPSRKLHPEDGYVRHPWVEKQNAFMDSESAFTSVDERDAAVRAYYGLCSFADFNVGRILRALSASGLSEMTNVIYTSDHGDNVGARGLWGKSNHYEESVKVPLIAAGPDFEARICETPVSLLDVSVTIPDLFDVPFEAAAGLVPLTQLASARSQSDRVVFSEYHAAGAVSGAYMLRQGRWKLIHYEGFAPELFDLEEDPEELSNLAAREGYASILADLQNALLQICNPAEVDRTAFADQDALIARFGGREAAFRIGAPGATPPPGS